MSLKTNVQHVTVLADPLSFTSEIKVVRGNPVQTYNRETGEFEADRKTLPCVLVPCIYVADPEMMMSGEVSVMGCEWYEGAPKPDRSNLIVNDAHYEIAAKGEPAWSLKVRKNFDQAHPVDIYAVYIFVDERKGMEVKMERSVTFRTAYYDLESLSLKIDKPEGFTINPLAQKETNAPWLHTITAQLYSGKTKVPGANAAYFWQKYENGTWMDITADDLEVWCSGKTGANWGATLTYDARFVPFIGFRCTAVKFEGVRPTTPKAGALVATCHSKVEFPHTLRVEMHQTKGVKIDGTMRTVVGFGCSLFDARDAVPEYQYSLFSINWWAQSGRPGSKKYLLAKGKEMEFIPAEVGMDRVYSNAVQAEVGIFDSAALITVANKAVTFGNNILISYKYK